MRRRVIRTALAALMLAVVGAAIAQPLTLSTTYGGVPANADRVLITEDDGRWREVKGEQGAYRIEVGSLRYSLAVVCFEPSGPRVTVYRFLVDELPELHHDCIGSSDLLAPRHRVRGEVVAFSSTEASQAGSGESGGNGDTAATPDLLQRPVPTVLSVHHGPLQLSVVAGFNTNFNVPVPGNLGSDLLALQSQAGQPPERAVLHRNVDLSAASRFMFDMGSADAVELDRFELALAPTAAAGGTVSLTARLLTCGGVVVDVGGGLLRGEEQQLPFAALPAEASAQCDKYELMARELPLEGQFMRLAAKLTSTPANIDLALPPASPMPVIDTVGTDPLRARLAWAPDQSTAFVVGGLTDGNVTWSFVQSPLLPPSVTLPPWGADAGVPQLRGGAYQWHFGAVRSTDSLTDVLAAYTRTERTGRYVSRSMPDTPLSFSVWLTGGSWLPLAADLPGGR